MQAVQLHRGIFESYARPRPTCPSCRRELSATERLASYNGVDVCAGCKAIQQVGDFSELFDAIFTSLAREIERLKNAIQERV